MGLMNAREVSYKALLGFDISLRILFRD